MQYEHNTPFLRELALMQETSIPALLWQEGEFDVQVGVESVAHAMLIHKLTPFTPVRDWDFSYDIQTLHLSQDIVFPGYIKEIQSHYDGSPKVLTFDYKEYSMSEAVSTPRSDRYRAIDEYNCSSFTSLLSPRATNIMRENYPSLYKLAKASVSNKDLCRKVMK